MKKILKWIGIGLGSLVVLILIAAGVLALVGNARLDKTYTVPAENLAIPTDAAAIDRGKHIVTSVCVYCHDENLGGKAVINAPSFAVLYATNLTSGDGGVGSEYTDTDWVRAIRHGVDPQGKSLLLMPANQFYYFSDRDLADVIAYIKSVPPVDHSVPDPQFSIIAKILLATGSLNHMDVASGIDQTGPRPSAPQPGVTAAYGAYLAETHECHACHGPDMAGGNDPDPSGPHVPNITPGGIAGWSEADFAKVIRIGTLPGGKILSDYMPWKIFGRMTDDELNAIWLYLQSLPASPATN